MTSVKLLMIRIRRLLGLHQCTAMEEVKGGFVCCVRHNWHIGQHKAYSGRILKGKIIFEPIGK